MKYLYIILFSSLFVLAGCTKQTLQPEHLDPQEWMRTHDAGRVAYVDYFTGNYIVETYGGYSVVEAWGGVIPRDFDLVYGHFSFRGVQTIYNRSGNYFTQGYIRDSWLSWSEALYLLDMLGNW